jgi:hypothetical protein
MQNGQLIQLRLAERLRSYIGYSEENFRGDFHHLLVLGLRGDIAGKKHRHARMKNRPARGSPKRLDSAAVETAVGCAAMPYYSAEVDLSTHLALDQFRSWSEGSARAVVPANSRKNNNALPGEERLKRSFDK